MTPAQRSLRARIGAFALHASGGTNTAPATAAFLDRFARQVDPDGTLGPEERARRAAYARRAYMAALSLRASLARSKAGAMRPAGVSASRGRASGATPSGPARRRTPRAAA
jgi:hypothetical protein